MKNYKKSRFNKQQKLDIQLYIAIGLILIGIILLMCGFWVNPMGEIHNSVLVAFGECCTFAGALMGVDYHYKFKTYIIDKDIDKHGVCQNYIKENENENVEDND